MSMIPCTRLSTRAAFGAPLLALAFTAAGLLVTGAAQAAPAAAASAPATAAPKAQPAKAAASAPRVVGKDGKEVVAPKWREKNEMPPSAHIATGMPGSGNLAMRGKRPDKLVDINSASVAELKTLPGVGDAEAQRIVANRPYLTKAALVEKKVLPMGPFVSLKQHVVAIPPPGALGSKPAAKGTAAAPAAAPVAQKTQPAARN